MKKYLLGCLFILGALISANAQQTSKTDLLIKINKEELKGKVLKITDSTIEFSYDGESAIYVFKKTEIARIQFASGRIEVITAADERTTPVPPGKTAESSATSGSSANERLNKIAILPFGFIRDGQASAEAISEQVQNECYVYLSKHAGTRTILQPRTTNVMLTRAGITQESIKGYTMDEICKILGVEYVVEGTVAMNSTSQTVSQSNSGTIKDKDESKKKYNSYSYGTATQNYKTSLTLNMFNDKGESVYSQVRTSFWNTADAYKSTLEYLLKRSPLYSK